MAVAATRFLHPSHLATRSVINQKCVFAIVTEIHEQLYAAAMRKVQFLLAKPRRTSSPRRLLQFHLRHCVDTQER